MAAFDVKPTFSKPISDQSKGYQKGFDRALSNSHVKLNEFDDLNSRLNEIDGMLGEAEQSLKKKIFSLAKMEALVFSDPKLAAIYEEMSENGEEKYGYHYNETIQNMLFNDYVLNSPKYLQKYKQAIPKEKKRRDKSGINQLKKSGEDMQTRNLEPKPIKPVTEGDEESTPVIFLVNEKDPGNPDLFAYFPEENYDKMGNSQMGYSHIGQHSAVHTEYAEESREATPEEYADLKAELEGLGYNLDVLNGQNSMSEMSGTGGAAGGPALGNSGQYSQKLALGETDSMSSGPVVGPAAWKKGGGDLLETGKKPFMPGAKVIQESQYLTETEGFEKFFNTMNEEMNMDMKDVASAQKSNEKPYTNRSVNNKIIDDTSAFTSNAVKQWNKPDTELELHTINTGTADEPNLKAMEENKKIEEKAVSKSQQKFMGMVHAVQKGELPANKVGGDVADAAKSMKPKDAEDFASTKHKGLPEKVKPKKAVSEDALSMIGDSPDTMANKPAPIGTQSSNMDMGARSSGGGSMSESTDLLEQINNELKAFAIHEEKLKRMTEDRKPSALVLKDRLGNDNQKNFKSDLKDSSVSKLVDIENSLEYADQQTEVKNPYELGEKLEKGEIKAGDMKSGEALKNVGDSANDEGDEIPKRNLSKEEQDEVNLYRLGLGDYVYDNEVGQRFEDRMKADMGDKLYELRKKKLEFRGKAPMYNKDPQPTAATTADKVQFDKEQTGWNEREGLKEGMVTAKYRDYLGKRKIIDFNLNEVWELKTDKPAEFLCDLSFDGLGNTYTQKVSVNENVVKAMSGNKFYTNGVEVFVLKTPAQNLSESAEKTGKPVVNEQMEKMKHLVGYNTATFVKQSKIL
jgi:hypothetical protein